MFVPPELQAFEREADEIVDTLPLWSLPLRSVLTTFFLSAESAFRGTWSARERDPDGPLKGSALISRMSYLLPLFRKCSDEVGADLDNALSVVRSSDALAMIGVMGYAHFSELMPEVWRGLYEVEETDDGFSFSHVDADARRAEERDIVLTELSLAAEVDAPPNVRAECYDAMGERFNIGPAIFAMQRLFEHRLSAINESHLVPSDLIQEALGFDRTSFHRVRAGLLALADVCLGLSEAAERKRNVATSARLRRHYDREMKEWAVPFLKESFALGTLQAISGVSASEISAVLDPFSLVVEDGDFGHGGEGYLPPLVRYPGSILFSPRAIRMSMPERNLLYVLNRRDPDRFGAVVANSMEPLLIDEMADTFLTIPGVEVAKAVSWDGGEIDLVVYQETTRTVLQVQAKAAIPPQGARMTAHIESRTNEAVNQLAKFKAADDEIQATALARAFNRSTDDFREVHTLSGVASRSGFGSRGAWADLGDAVPLTPALLRGVLSDGASGIASSLPDIWGSVPSVLDRAVSYTTSGWRRDQIILLNGTLSVPLLDLNPHKVYELRRSWARDTF